MNEQESIDFVSRCKQIAIAKSDMPNELFSVVQIDEGGDIDVIFSNYQDFEKIIHIQYHEFDMTFEQIKQKKIAEESMMKAARELVKKVELEAAQRVINQNEYSEYLRLKEKFD